MIEGDLMALVDAVLNKQADGYIPPEASKDRNERQKMIETFASSFLEDIFADYCKNERSLLRKNINLIRKGAEAYYVKTYTKSKQKEESN